MSTVLLDSLHSEISPSGSTVADSPADQETLDGIRNGPVHTTSPTASASTETVLLQVPSVVATVRLEAALSVPPALPLWLPLPRWIQ